MAVIKECTCVSKYQDEKYGKNKRVMNSCGEGKGNAGYRCTVCGQTKSTGK